MILGGRDQEPPESPALTPGLDGEHPEIAAVAPHLDPHAGHHPSAPMRIVDRQEARTGPMHALTDLLRIGPLADDEEFFDNVGAIDHPDEFRDVGVAGQARMEHAAHAFDANILPFRLPVPLITVIPFPPGIRP
jgi:hypothetical protein